MAQTRPSPTLSRGFTRLGRFLAQYAMPSQTSCRSKTHLHRYGLIIFGVYPGFPTLKL